MYRLLPAMCLPLFLGAATGCAPDPAANRGGDTPDPAVLMDADRQFAADVAEGGAEAWADWFAEDGAMIQAGAGEIRGRTAIREAVGYLDQPGVALRWEPTRAEIAASGDLGWTTGSYTFRSGPDEPVSGRGRYVSIWRKELDGGWKVVMDLGNPVTEDGA